MLKVAYGKAQCPRRRKVVPVNIGQRRLAPHAQRNDRPCWESRVFRLDIIREGEKSYYPPVVVKPLSKEEKKELKAKRKAKAKARRRKRQSPQLTKDESRKVEEKRRKQNSQIHHETLKRQHDERRKQRELQKTPGYNKGYSTSGGKNLFGLSPEVCLGWTVIIRTGL